MLLRGFRSVAASQTFSIGRICTAVDSSEQVLPLTLRRCMAKSMVRGSVPTNIYIESPQQLLVDPDTQIPKSSVLNPLGWAEQAKFKTQQATTRKKIFSDIKKTEGEIVSGIKIDYEKRFAEEALELYKSLCQGRFQGIKNKVKLSTTRHYGESVLMSKEFALLQETLAKHPKACIDWKILSPTHEIIFSAMASLGSKAMPLDFAQISVRFESDQSLAFSPNADQPPPAKPLKKIIERYVFERCLSRKGSSWRICHRLVEAPPS